MEKVTAKDRKEARRMRRKKRQQNPDVVATPTDKKDHQNWLLLSKSNRAKTSPLCTVLLRLRRSIKLLLQEGLDGVHLSKRRTLLGCHSHPLLFFEGALVERSTRFFE